MQFLKKCWKNKGEEKLLFGSTKKELKKFFCGIGEIEINDKSIKILNYPFEPSKVYPSKVLLANEIDEIQLEQYPPTMKLDNELIFISREQVGKLKEFAIQNSIKLANRQSNWNYITEPFLDTEFDDDEKARTNNLLSKNGLSIEEVNQLRKEISEQMYKYNFDTMLWEWGILGINDVLSAMRPKLSKEEFYEFYWKAMEIEQRKSN